MIWLIMIIWLLSVALAIYAYVASPADFKWPMQWGLDGRPTWYAGRALASSFAVATTTITIGTWLLLTRGISTGAGGLLRGWIGLLIVLLGLGFQVLHWQLAMKLSRDHDAQRSAGDIARISSTADSKSADR